jgi:hypothetical protein
LESLGVGVQELGRLAKNDPRKIAVAAVVKSGTVVGNAWIAERLHMGAAGRVSRYCSEAGRTPEVEKLMKTIASKSKG